MSKTSFLFILQAILILNASAQETSRLNDLPELVMTEIPGAPVLEHPVLVTGSLKPVLSEGHGLAAPALFDMNGDGLLDLLIGEFGSGIEHGKFMGNFIRIYANTGTGQEPRFTGRFYYARPPFEYQVESHGTPYSVDQFCCVGFTPQLIDLDEDGYMDITTGSYQGEVYWLRGSDIGFRVASPLDQQGSPRGRTWVKEQPYWLFSSASFGDFTGDGLADLITGGHSLRISRNVGSKEAPAFEKRELILDVEGNPLNVYKYAARDSAEFRFYGSDVPVGGDIDLSPYVFDWNGDGLLDLLVTNSFSHAGLDAVTFFERVRTAGGIIFKKGVPLFTAKGNVKSFPGSAPHLFIGDWNGDDVNDLILGTSIITTNGQYNPVLSWRWEKELHLLGPGKDPAAMNENNLTAEQLQRYKNDAKVPEGLSVEEYMTLRHQGRIYVLLGKKPKLNSSQEIRTKTKNSQR